MIRGIVGFAVPVVGVAMAAAALVGPSLVAGPRGEAIVVAASGAVAELQPASFKPADCGALRLVALTFESGAEGVSMALQEIAPDESAPRGALLLVLDPAGEVVGVNPADAFGRTAGALLALGCHGGPQELPLPGAV
jgi:hypothetical protein